MASGVAGWPQAMPRANLEHARRPNVPGLDHALGEQEVAGLEHFELGQHARVANRDRHDLEMLRRIDEYARAHVEAAHVEAADFRRSSSTWRTRSCGLRNVLLGRPCSDRPVMDEARARPGVRLISTSVPLERIRSTTRVKCAVHAGLGGFGIAT